MRQRITLYYKIFSLCYKTLLLYTTAHHIALPDQICNVIYITRPPNVTPATQIQSHNYGKTQDFSLRLSITISLSAAPATKNAIPSSPNTTSARENESHEWSASLKRHLHMKRHLQCAEKAQSASNPTEFCACHEICMFKISVESPWIAAANARTIQW